MEETPIVERAEESPKKKESIWDLVRFTILTLAIVIPLRTYVAQPFIVSGDSMYPTFEDGQYLIIDEFSYHFRTPERGEVVIFRYPKDPSKYFIKRVIGLPGETVSISRGTVAITTKDGETVNLDEPYINAEGYETQTTTLKDDQYFVMGDNRPLSLDSRSWGPVEEEKIKGRVLMRLLPVTKANILPGFYSQETK
ncbi:MAG TPA: signal peptidase I [Candidatus Paceibacterota bacterium]|nr:signal peptidase I [Candidatus Paceibacterota bacterium]